MVFYTLLLLDGLELVVTMQFIHVDRFCELDIIFIVKSVECLSILSIGGCCEKTSLAGVRVSVWWWY